MMFSDMLFNLASDWKGSCRVSNTVAIGKFIHHRSAGFLPNEHCSQDTLEHEVRLALHHVLDPVIYIKTDTV